MIDKIPTSTELSARLGQPLYDVWESLCSLIEEKYDMDRLWNSGGKAWTYEYKYRRGGKTLCTLYAGEGRMGLMIVFGKAEREKVETIRDSLSESVRQSYDGAKTYHDGKWVMFCPADTSPF